MSDHPIAQTLDVRGLACPLPVLRAKKALKTIEIGQCLEIQATDPGSVSDMPVFCRQTGHVMVHSRIQDGVFIFVIQRGV